MFCLWLYPGSIYVLLDTFLWYFVKTSVYALSTLCLFNLRSNFVPWETFQTCQYIGQLSNTRWHTESIQLLRKSMHQTKMQYKEGVFILYILVSRIFLTFYPKAGIHTTEAAATHWCNNGENSISLCFRVTNLIIKISKISVYQNIFYRFLSSTSI